MTQALRQQRLSLSSSTVAFAVCFAAWTLFSILGVEIRRELELNYTQFAVLLVAPILTGSLARLPAGLLADIYGGRRVMFGLMLIVGIVMLFFPYATSYAWYLVFGMVIGLAGATYAAGITFVSAWHRVPPWVYSVPVIWVPQSPTWWLPLPLSASVAPWFR